MTLHLYEDGEGFSIRVSTHQHHMTTINIKDSRTTYLVGTVDTTGEFWCELEIPFKHRALQIASEKSQSPDNTQRWVVVRRTTTFKQLNISRKLPTIQQ